MAPFVVACLFVVLRLAGFAGTFPRPDLAVTWTGLLEIAGAVGMLVPATTPYAAVGLAVLLVAMFPANVHAARAKVSIGGRPVTALPQRAALQVMFVAAVLGAGLAG